MDATFEVGVVGAGYVGLVTSASLAHIGHQVTLVDKDVDKIQGMRRGELPISEPGLGDLIAENAGSWRLGTKITQLVRDAEFVFLAVDTPPGEGGSTDLSNVAEVAREIGCALAKTERERPLIVVNKSTVPVGGGDYVFRLIQEGLSDTGGAGAADFRVVSNPEFLREGSAIRDSLFPERIVLGADDQDALDAMQLLYSPIIDRSFASDSEPVAEVPVPVVITDLASAEMIKYAANTFLATKISFINEISNICEFVGADVTSVASGLGLDGRIGSRFLSAGIGWGGSCFPKDVSSLKAIAGEHDYDAKLLAATTSINDGQRERVINKLQRHLHTLKGKRVALLGLSFKPDTDDLREAPSLEIARMLVAQGARVTGYDPVSGKKALRTMPELHVTFDPYRALEGAHAAVLVTEWGELRELDLPRAESIMEEPRIFLDGRNLLDPRGVREAGLLYEGFGRV